MRARRPTDSGCAAITGLAELAATRQAAESAYTRAADAETGRIAGDRAAVPDAGCRRRQRGPLREPDEHLLQRPRGPGRMPRSAGAGMRSTPPISKPETCSTGAPSRTRRNCARRSSCRAISTAPVVHDPPALASAETDQERRRILLARSADARAALAGDYFAHARALRAPGASARGLGRLGDTGTRCGNPGQPLRAIGAARQPPVREPRAGSSICKR